MAGALKAALSAILPAAAALADFEAFDEPAFRMELARRLREEAEQLDRQAVLLRSMALGIGTVAEVEITPDSEEAC